MKKLLFMALASLLLSFGGASQAAEKEDIDKLRLRVDELEKRIKETEVVDELGHKFHPIHSIYGLKIGGTITLTAQGSTNDNVSGALALSGDLALESPVGDRGRAVMVLDFQRGAGLENLPSFFVGPNGSPTGPNADIESFDNDQVHLTQLYYEHDLSERLTVSIGQLDPTGYFDANNFANNERANFLANIFVNNPAIEWGGSSDFYSPGVRVTYFPAENFDVSIGAFEGDGDYVEAFDKPFLIAEANLKIAPNDKEGNYRLLYWYRQGRPDISTTSDPTEQYFFRAPNFGAAVSIDQYIIDTVGFWFRAGYQRETVSQFDRFAGAGLHFLADALGRPNDVAGIGYGVTFISTAYEDFKKSSNASFSAEPEHYLEAYYNIAVGDVTDSTGFHITPDIQYVLNPGGDNDADDTFIYGIRLQTFF